MHGVVGWCVQAYSIIESRKKLKLFNILLEENILYFMLVGARCHQFACSYKNKSDVFACKRRL